MSAGEQQLAFKIHGMDCAEEVAVLKQQLGPLVGGAEHLQFDLINSKLILGAGASDVSPEAIIEAVAQAGMRAELWVVGGDDRSPSWWQRHGRLALTAASGLCGLVGLLCDAWLRGSLLGALAGHGFVPGAAGLMPVAFYLVGIAAAMAYVVPKAWRSARALRPDMNLLMTVAVAGAALIGQWFEAATVAFLFSLSLVLESWSVSRARRAIAALMDLAPPVARLRDEAGREQLVPIEQVAVGSVFFVRPGERIPLDGQVASGTSQVNQAPITGESMPVVKQPGDEVFAGTINGDGALEIRSTRPAQDTTLARIIRMVGQAQSRRAPSERWVDQFARWYTPAVMLLAVTVLLVPPLLAGASWSDWFYRALVLLVIACPCALVISTPVSIVAALASAARHGTLVKGGLFIELPARLRAVALDKTGTLTQGRPSVVDVVPLSGHDQRELLQRAAAMEAHSNHPLAQAIVAAARERGISFPAAADFQIIPGKGATGRFNGKQYWLGSHRLLEERGQETPQVHQQLEAMAEAGRTVVIVGQQDHVCGFITLADQLRPAAREVVCQLRRAGVRHVVMLTGDNEGTARAIGRQAEVDEVYAELMPEEKVEVIQSLVERYGQVAMVGDGVNDAPALARASLGIAMGAAGSDAAIETADIALMSDDLSNLPWLIRHSRRTLAIVRQNISFALAVKLLFVILTFAGFASLWAAIAADMGASLLVIFNGLRLLQTNH